MNRTHSFATPMRRLRAASLAALAWVVFSAGTCQVSYCSDHDGEDCDPCVSVCRCDQVCVHASASDARELFGLRAYELVTEAGEDGVWSRSYRSSGGPIVERAFGERELIGERELTRGVLELFARNVVRANAALFGPLDACTTQDVEARDAGILIRFARAGDEHGSLVLWLDPRGRLLEVEHRGLL
jgi:hypothetical protein